eukprot:COSAG05_NODE_2180_length_3432_cov_2.161416_1_plen_75_part_00
MHGQGILGTVGCIAHSAIEYSHGRAAPRVTGRAPLQPPLMLLPPRGLPLPLPLRAATARDTARDAATDDPRSRA